MIGTHVKRMLLSKLIFLLLQMLFRKANVFPTLKSLALISGSKSALVPGAYLSKLVGFLDRISMDNWCIRVMGLSEVLWFLPANLEAVNTRSLVMALMSVWGWPRKEMSSAKSKSLSGW